MNKLLQLYHNENRYFDIFTGADALVTKRYHVENVLKHTEKLYGFMQPSGVDKDLLLICGEHHDDGRVDQYRLLGKFWDTEVSHNVLGVDRFDKWLTNYGYFDKRLDESVEIFRNVMLYHGRMHLSTSIVCTPYIHIITAADDMENAAACVSYLVREVEQDAKGYRQNNPEANQTAVSYFVFDCFACGKKFDKSKYCTTYAEYVLFAATLMTSTIANFPFANGLLLQSGYGYDTILDGYKDVFSKTLSPEMAAKAYDILVSYSKKR